MSGFDLVVLLIVGTAAAGGFLRGFVQEALSLLAWIVSIVALRYLHTDIAGLFFSLTGGVTTSALLAFVALLLIPYLAMRMIARRFGEDSRHSALGPIDRVLGFGFGGIKGAAIAAIAFSLLVLGYDRHWAFSGRPGWMTEARTYPVLNASSEEIVPLIAEQRAAIEGRDDARAKQP